MGASINWRRYSEKIVTWFLKRQPPPKGGKPADPLPSWNEGPAKKTIVEFVRFTTDKDGPKFVSPEQRIATFDQDGTPYFSSRYTRSASFRAVATIALAAPARA